MPRNVQIIDQCISHSPGARELLMRHATPAKGSARLTLPPHRFFNPADSCAEEITVYVEPAFAGADQFKVVNLIEEENVGGVPVNGVPGVGINVTTLSGYVGKPILPFSATLNGCNYGGYNVAIRASLSAEYKISITVNKTVLFGSPFLLTIHPQIQAVTLGVPTDGLVTYNRLFPPLRLRL